MRRFTPTTKRNGACEVCGSETGKCRRHIDNELHLCMTYADARLGRIENGFKCVKADSGSGWASFKLDNSQEWSQRNRLEWLARNEQNKQKQALEDEQRRQRSLSVVERDQQYRLLLDELTLHPDDRADLIRRGFTREQIELASFKSVELTQQLQSRYNELLPGIKVGNKGLIISSAGYLCPVTNAEGQIVACQIRLRSIPTGEHNRYRWLSGEGQTLHLYPEGCSPKGELPLPVFRPQGLTEGIALAEGTGAKPFLVSQRLNLLTIGAAGGQWASSPELFRSTLEKAHLEVKTKEIKIFPDAGDILNPCVMNRWQKVFTLLEEWGWSVRIGWWGQIDKTHPDIDELELERINQISLLTIASFQAICQERSGLLFNNKLSQQTEAKSWEKNHEPNSSKNTFKTLERCSNASWKDGQCQEPQEENPSFTLQSLTRQQSSFMLSTASETIPLLTDTTSKGSETQIPVESKSLKPRLSFNCLKEDNPLFEEKIRQVQRQLRSLSYPPDILLNQRYLPDNLPNQLPKSGLIGLVAPKGSGKSFLLKNIISLAKKSGGAVLSITPRIALGREQAIKWEITWIDDSGVMKTQAKDTTKQIQEVALNRQQAKDKLAQLEKISHHQLNLLGENAQESLEQQKNNLRIEIEQYGEQIENIHTASAKTLALCWDSLWRATDRDLKDSLIIIDEAELGFKHFINGSTCKRNRPHLLKVFKEKIIECLISGGRVILSDADLTDLPVNYIRQILPIPIKPFIVKNEYIGDETRWIVEVRTESKGDTLTGIIEAIGDGEYLAITTDSQAEAQALEECILRKFKNEFCALLDAKGKVSQEAITREKALIVRVDRTTTEAETVKKFIQKPNEQILFWKPRILIYTPSMGVGVSIDETTQRWDEEWQENVPYFDAVHGLFFGVIEPSEVRQQLARFRANVPRIVYCKESNKALEGCSSFFPEEVKRQTLKYNHSALNILDIAKGIAGYEADDEQIREAMLQLLTEAWDENSRCWKEPSIDLASAFKARENYGLWNLANLLREELEDEGHTVVTLEGVKTDLVAQMADIKDELKMEEAALIAEASTMPVEEARKILKKLGVTKEESRSAQKTLLQEELPQVNLTPTFVKKAIVDDRRQWLNQQRLFWYYSNTEAVKQIDTDHWLSSLKKFTQGTPFMRDIRSHVPKVEALSKSGVFEFVDLSNCERIYQGDTPEAKAFLKKCLKHKDDLKIALNILVTNKSSPIGLANRILSKVGLKLEKLTRSNKDTRWRLSTNLVNDPDRTSVLKAFELRWKLNQKEASQKLAEKQPQMLVQKATQPGGQSTDYINPHSDCPPENVYKNQEGANREISSQNQNESVLSKNAQFCLQALADLETPNHPTICNLEQLFELFASMEAVGQECEEELPSDFWSRVSTALGVVSESLEAMGIIEENSSQIQSDKASQLPAPAPQNVYITDGEGVSTDLSNENPRESVLGKNTSGRMAFAGLVERLRYAFNFKAFCWVISGWATEVVEDAIALQDEQPIRSKMSGWLSSASTG